MKEEKQIRTLRSWAKKYLVEDESITYVNQFKEATTFRQKNNKIFQSEVVYDE